MQNISGGTFKPLNPPSTSVCHWGCPRCAWGGSDAGWDELCPTSPPQDGGVGLRTLHSLHAWGHGAITVVMLISSDSSGGGKGGEERAAVRLPSLCQLYPSSQRGSISGAHRWCQVLAVPCDPLERPLCAVLVALW